MYSDRAVVAKGSRPEVRERVARQLVMDGNLNEDLWDYLEDITKRHYLQRAENMILAVEGKDGLLL